MAVYKKIAHEGLGVRRFLARVLLADDFRRLGHALAGDLDHAGRDKELARRRVHARGEIRPDERLRQLLERRVVVTAEQPPAPAHDSKAAPYALHTDAFRIVPTHMFLVGGSELAFHPYIGLLRWLTHILAAIFTASFRNVVLVDV